MGNTGFIMDGIYNCFKEYKGVIFKSFTDPLKNIISILTIQIKKVILLKYYLMSFAKLKINQRSFYYLPNSAF